MSKKLDMLYILQPSVNDGEKWLLLADSNTNMMRGFMGELAKYRSEPGTIRVTIVGPHRRQCVDLEQHEDLFGGICEQVDAMVEDGDLTYHPVLGKPVDANAYRYDFDYIRDGEPVHTWLHNSNDEEKLRVFWCNIPEQTANYMSILAHPKSEAEDVIVFNSCYFLDSPIHPKTGVDAPTFQHRAINWHRQVEGALRADVVGFCCDGNRHQFFEGLQATHTNLVQEEITKKTRVFRFGYSEDELNTLKEIETAHLDHCMQTSERKLLVFPNRITVPDYTNFELLEEALAILETMRDDWWFVATNPGQKYVTHLQLKERWGDNYCFIGNEDFDRINYVNLLQHADAHISLFVEEANGGCACREAMHLRSLPIMPFANEYTRLARADYPGFVNVHDGKMRADDLAMAISEVLDVIDENYTEHRTAYDFCADKYVFNHYKGSFRASVREVMETLQSYGLR